MSTEDPDTQVCVDSVDKPWTHESILRRLYHDEGLTQLEIADRLGCDDATVSRHMDRHDIERRSRSDAASMGRVGRDAHEVLSDPDELGRLYLDEGMSSLEIADHLGCDDTTVRQWMARHDIPVRSLSDARRGKLLGEENPAWNGGYEGYYGPNWPEQRRKRLERDDYECVVCTLSNEAHNEEHGRDLHVHHIRPFAQFEQPDGTYDYEAANDLENLLTLCQPHHIEWEGIPLRPQRE